MNRHYKQGIFIEQDTQHMRDLQAPSISFVETPCVCLSSNKLLCVNTHTHF